MKELNKPYWSSDLEVIIKNLDVDPARELSDEEVKKRQEKFGLNSFGDPEPKSSDEILKHFKLSILALIFINLIFYLAIFIPTAIFCGIVSISNDGGLILTIMILVSIVAVKSLQMYLGFKTYNALKPWLDDKLKVDEPEEPKITVFREGKEKEIENRELVPGDIIIFGTEGEEITVDARLLESNELEIDECVLTGSSTYSKKDISLEVSPGSNNLGDAVNSVFANSFVRKGNGKAVVVATGKNTEIYKMSTPIDLPFGFGWGPTPADKYKKQAIILSGMLLIFFMMIMILSWIYC